MKKDGSLQFRIQEMPAPEGLRERILARIELAKRHSAQIRAGLSALLAVFSLAAFVPVITYTAEQFYASGFYDYLSLLLSDRTLLLTYWREFALSLLESLPSLALLLLLPIV